MVPSLRLKKYLVLFVVAIAFFSSEEFTQYIHAIYSSNRSDGARNTQLNGKIVEHILRESKEFLAVLSTVCV